MAHVLKFRTGEVVRVVSDHVSLVSHKAEIGKEYTIIKTVLESREGISARNYQEYLLDNDSWVAEDEIEAVTR